MEEIGADGDVRAGISLAALCLSLVASYMNAGFWKLGGECSYHHP